MNKAKQASDPERVDQLVSNCLQVPATDAGKWPGGALPVQVGVVQTESESGEQ